MKTENEKQKRLSYNVNYKLEVIKYERHVGSPPILTFFFVNGKIKEK